MAWCSGFAAHRHLHFNYVLADMYFYLSEYNFPRHGQTIYFQEIANRWTRPLRFDRVARFCRQQIGPLPPSGFLVECVSAQGSKVRRHGLSEQGDCFPSQWLLQLGGKPGCSFGSEFQQNPASWELGNSGIRKGT